MCDDVTAIYHMYLTIGEWRYISNMIKVASADTKNEELKKCLMEISLNLNPDYPKPDYPITINKKK